MFRRFLRFQILSENLNDTRRIHGMYLLVDCLLLENLKELVRELLGDIDYRSGLIETYFMMTCFILLIMRGLLDSKAKLNFLSSFGTTATPSYKKKIINRLLRSVYTLAESISGFHFSIPSLSSFILIATSSGTF